MKRAESGPSKFLVEGNRMTDEMKMLSMKKAVWPDIHTNYRYRMRLRIRTYGYGTEPGSKGRLDFVE